MQFKQLPEEVSISEDDSAVVVGWTGDRSFVVKTYDPGQATSTEPFDLDNQSSVETDKPTTTLSLWDWGLKQDISLKEFDELQNSLETYIEVED